MLPTGFRTFHFVSCLYIFFFSFLFLLFRFFSHYFVFVFLRFVFFRFFSLLFSLFSFRFFSFRFFSFLFVFFRFSVYRYPIIRKFWGEIIRFTIIPNGKWKNLLNNCSFPKYRYSRLAWLYIHKRSWHNKWGPVSLGGGHCHTRLLVLEEGGGGWRWQDIKMLYFWLIYAQYWYSLNNTVIPCVFLPFLA